ncbi:hypothetical protein BGZ97_009576, partial [Linnemannia gamsii]
TAHITRLRRDIPDLVCLKENSDPELPESVLFPIEIKRLVLLQPGDLLHDYLVEDRTEDTRRVMGPVNQVFGYMRLNGYRYGILSTYEQTWFMK